MSRLKPNRGKLTRRHIFAALFVVAVLGVAVALVSSAPPARREIVPVKDITFGDPPLVQHPAPGFSYEVVYSTATGEIVQLSGYPVDSTFVRVTPRIQNGTATLVVTENPQLGPLWEDFRQGSIGEWFVDHASRELRHR
jgi:hypothetical protein